MLYAEAEILRKGNERLLDNLEEGVVILEEGTTNVQFANKSAKKMNFKTENHSFFGETAEIGELHVKNETF